MIVTSVDQLRERQTAMDAQAGALVASTNAAHATPHDLSLRGIHSPASRVNVGICEDCGDPEFTVTDSRSGITEPKCRMCINAIRRQSLQHTQYVAEICYNCEITYDSIGLVTGATHTTKPLSDRPNRMGGVILGWTSLVAAGWVEIDDETDIVMVHRTTHTADEHCDGCEHIRHPGCDGVGRCDDHKADATEYSEGFSG
mgnify:CR=1 FL=1